jgi:acyl carrier protein
LGGKAFWLIKSAGCGIWAALPAAGFFSGETPLDLISGDRLRKRFHSGRLSGLNRAYRCKNFGPGVGKKMSDDLNGIILNVARIIIDELKLENVTAETFDPDLDLVDELGVDSMDIATVALVIQDEYGITIEEEDYPGLKNVRLLSEYILNKLSGKADTV